MGKNTNDIMKWSWKTFGLQLVVTFVVALGLAYGISMIIDAKRGPEAPNSTLISMALGGFLAPLILSTVAGWKAWALKSPLIVAFIVAGIYASNPAILAKQGGQVTGCVFIKGYFRSLSHKIQKRVGLRLSFLVTVCRHEEKQAE